MSTECTRDVFLILSIIVRISRGEIIEEDDGPLVERIGGGSAINIINIPYQACTVDKFNTSIVGCGGVIISRTHILTAAHCIEGLHNVRLLKTSLSEIQEEGEIREIEKVVIHKAYNDTTFDNDIAVMKVKTPIEFNQFQQQIEIARPDEQPKAGDVMLISGYGYIKDKTPSTRLKVATVKVIDQTVCQSIWGKIKNSAVTDNMFCATSAWADACIGDSGGPAVINTKLYGIVNSGIGCKTARFPGVYTRIHKYYDWILKNTKEEPSTSIFEPILNIFGNLNKLKDHILDKPRTVDVVYA